MANDKKFIVKNGLRADNIEFTDSQSGTNQITLSMLNSDTLNFEGDAGSLFSIADDLTGSVFTVGDVSGIPIVDINGDTHNITMAQFDGKVMIGGTDSGSTDSDVLNVTGNIKGTAFYGDGSNLTGISGGVSSDADNNTLGGSGALGNVLSGSGTRNTAFGKSALNALTSADRNTAVGYQALLYNQTGNLNTAVGDQAATGVSGNSHSGTTAIGYAALSSITTGTDNTGVGYAAGFTTSSGGSNTYIGTVAGYTASTSSQNSFVGMNAGRNQTGSFNTLMGYEAGYYLTNSSNVAIGHSALKATSGNANSSSNVAVGQNAGLRITSTDYNVFIGNNAGSYVTSGNNNTIVGQGAGAGTGDARLTTGSRNVIIGAYAYASAADVSNEITLGSSTVTSLRCNVQTISSLSDERDKSDIKTLPDATDFIKALNPVSFTWNQRDGGREGIEDHGFTAQELLSAQEETGYTIPNLVSKNNPDKLEAAYGRLLPTLVSVIKKQQNTIETLEKRISALENL